MRHTKHDDRSSSTHVFPRTDKEQGEEAWKFGWSGEGEEAVPKWQDPEEQLQDMLAGGDEHDHDHGRGDEEDEGPERKKAKKE